MLKFPQVLLIGNGLNIYNGGDNWDNFLRSIADKKMASWFGKMESPMALQAILLSNNTLDTKLKDKSKELMPKEQLRDVNGFWNKLLSVDFDDIITTNYTYEIEQAYYGGKALKATFIENLSKNVTGRRVESKYLISTCNEIISDKAHRVWHIHGEARKPSSMILGHYYYVYLLNRVIKFIDERKHTYKWEQDKNLQISIESWIDSFILGDVYIIGQGFGFSEIDLWWLLNRKMNEKAKHGKVYFYAPTIEKEKEKLALLEVLGVKIENMGIVQNNITKKVEYELFYDLAIEDIKKKVLKNKKDSLFNK